VRQICCSIVTRPWPTSAAAVTLAGCAVASQQQVADHCHTGSEDQPWTEHQQVDRGHVRLPSPALKFA